MTSNMKIEPLTCSRSYIHLARSEHHLKPEGKEHDRNMRLHAKRLNVANHALTSDHTTDFNLFQFLLILIYVYHSLY